MNNEKYNNYQFAACDNDTAIEIKDSDTDSHNCENNNEDIMTVSELQSQLTQAKDRIAVLENLETTCADQHSRLLADFANYRNRVSREIQFAVNLAEKKLLLELLPAVDNLERCLSSNYVKIEDLSNGASLIYKQLTEILRKIGVEGIDVKIGDPFDAQYAEALTAVNQKELPDGSVAMVFEKGFTFHKDLLRPARVAVNHNNDQVNVEQIVK